MNSTKKRLTNNKDSSLKHEETKDNQVVTAKRRKIVDPETAGAGENSTSSASISTSTAHEGIGSESEVKTSRNTSDTDQEIQNQKSEEINGSDSMLKDNIANNQNQNKIIDIKQELPEATEPLVEHDPGKREIRTSQDRDYLIKLGPNQPILRPFPRQEKCTRRFCAEWYKKYPFLEYSVHKDAAFCFVCSLFPDGPKRSGLRPKNWVNIGVRNWKNMGAKNGSSKVHFNSKAHKAALEDYEHFINEAARIDVMLKQIQNEMDDSEEESDEST